MRFLILVSILVTSIFCFAGEPKNTPLNEESSIALDKLNEIKETRLACIENIEPKNDEATHAKCLDDSRRPLENVLLDFINVKLAKVKKPEQANQWVSVYISFKAHRIATVSKLRDDNFGKPNVKSILYAEHISLTEEKIMTLLDLSN